MELIPGTLALIMEANLCLQRGIYGRGSGEGKAQRVPAVTYAMIQWIKPPTCDTGIS